MDAPVVDSCEACDSWAAGSIWTQFCRQARTQTFKWEGQGCLVNQNRRENQDNLHTLPAIGSLPLGETLQYFVSILHMSTGNSSFFKVKGQRLLLLVSHQTEQDWFLPLHGCGAWLHESQTQQMSIEGEERIGDGSEGACPTQGKVRTAQGRWLCMT